MIGEKKCIKTGKSSHRLGIILLIAAAVVALGYLASFLAAPFFSDSSWINEMGYETSEVYPLAFNWPGDRSCPEVPVKVGADEYPLGFDTGCGAGVFFTDILDEKIQYTILNKSEIYNRDGSHRGWEKRIMVDEITVFGDVFTNVKTGISDWTLYSSRPLNGTIGLAYFQGKVITLDYAGRKIAIGSQPIDYSKLDPTKYAVLPLHKTTSRGQEDLPFFQAEMDGKPVMVYLDTGKNYSYLHNPDCKYSMGDKPAGFTNVPLKIGQMEIMMKDVAQVYDLAQAEGLPYPTMLELNSDQIWKGKLLVTIDLIDGRIIFRKL